MENDLLDDNQVSSTVDGFKPASFKKRLFATGIDSFILMGVYVMFSDVIIDYTYASFIYPYWQLVSYIGISFYFALGESSLKQGTLGKQWMNIKVIDTNENRISLGLALGRFLIKLSLSPILLVVLLAEKDSGRQGGILGTYVVEKF